MNVFTGGRSRGGSQTGAKAVSLLFLFLQILGLSLLRMITPVSAKAIIGVDLGSLYMKVALVQRNSPLEIVTNLHSKRKTEQMVLFDQGSRFYGADASSLLARKPQLTPAAMSIMLGRDASHPTVQVLAERHYPLKPSYNESRSGVCLTVDGKDFTPEELVAMVLTHAKDITKAFGDESAGAGGGAIVRDCVLTVPSFYTQHERRALLDAATLADLNVLALIDETTAAALHYGMDRIETEPQNVLFYNMGASALQVSLVTFYSYEHKDGKYSKGKTVGAFEVRGKAWDATLGGTTFDNRLVEYMADEFNKQWNDKRADGKQLDVRVNPRAMTKLRIQANKLKHVLSANNDMPVYIDALHDDTPFQLHVTRAEFEQLCHDLLLRASKPIEMAVIEAAGLTMEDVHSVELIGGGMRIPKVREEITKSLGEHLDLGMHINSDESMALGAAFHGANVSTAFRVRHVGMIDVNPFPIQVSLETLDVEGRPGGLGNLFGIPKNKKKKKATEAPSNDASSSSEAEGSGEEDAATKKDDKEDGPWQKQATLFKGFGKVGVKKTIAFTQDQDVHCSLDYEDDEVLPEGTEHGIVRYNITGVTKFAQEMSEKGLGKPKVSLQFEMTSSGISQLIKAEAAVEEIVMVTEEVEVEVDDDDENDENATDATGEDAAPATEEEGAEESKKDEEGDAAAASEPTDGEGEEEKKEGEEEGGDGEKKNETDDSGEEKKKKKKVKKTVEKEKKKVHKRQLDITSYFIGKVQPYSEEIMIESKAKLAEMAKADKARMELEAMKNTFESYIYHVKNKLSDDEENISKVSTDEQRSSLLQLAIDAGDWLDFDGWDADYDTYEKKYKELYTPAEEIFFRVKEATARPEAITKLNGKLTKVEELMMKWETTHPQVTEDERKDVLEKIEKVRKELVEKEEGQAAINAWDTPVFTSEEIPPMTKSLEQLVSKLNKKPKPKPIVEEKNETTTTDENATDEIKEEGGGEDGGDGDAPAEEGGEGAADDEDATPDDEDTPKGEEEKPAADGDDEL